MQRKYPLLLVASLLVGSFVASCGPSEPEPKAAPPAPPPPPPAPPPPAPENTAAAAPTPPPPPPKATAVVDDFPPSPDPKPLPTARITAPANEASIDASKAKDTVVKLDVRNWATATGDRHVHLILDAHPYKAIYDPKQPVKLSELLPEGTDLTEGQHVLHAFPSRASHESVKGKGASSMVTFWVGKKGKATIDPKKPHLVYSRPKGNNPGEMGQALMIDFYLHNTTLQTGEKVRYTVSGEQLAAPATGFFTAWAPKVVRGLPKGDYQVRLELLDKDGNPMGGPLDDVTRVVQVDPGAPNDPAMGQPLSAAGSAGAATPAGSAGAATPAGTAGAASPAGSAGAAGAAGHHKGH